MTFNSFTVREQIVIAHQYKGIGITSKLKAYYLPTGEAVSPRFYNGRIAYQYRKLRVGLTTLRRQRRCPVLLTVQIPALPF